MTTEIIPFSDVKERLRERVQSALLDLIPPEALDKFVQDAYQRFLQDGTYCAQGHPVTKTDFHGCRVCAHGHGAVESELRVLIQAAMTEIVRDKIKAWADEWKAGPDAEAMAADVLVRASAAASKGFIESVAYDIVTRAAYAVGVSVRCGNCRRDGAPKGQNCPGCGCYNP